MPVLEIEGLRCRFGAVEVLRGVSLSVDKGDVVGLIGPSGSGKSTLLRVIVGLTPPTGGAIRLDGRPVDYASAASLRAARERMAIVFQQYNLFQNMTALDNVAVAPIKVQKRPAAEVRAEATRLLERVGLGAKLRAYPDELSGGQQQRVAIARALALRPEILLLDEVTSALDPELVAEVLETIRGLARDGMTMLIVSHEMGFVREVSKRVTMMDAGAVVEEGAPDEFLAAPRSDRARAFLGKIARESRT